MNTYSTMVLKADSLKDIHEQIDEAKRNGWSPRSGLKYTYLDGEQGWEMEMERRIYLDEFSTPPYTFVEDMFFYGLLVAAGIGLIAVTMAAVHALYAVFS